MNLVITCKKERFLMRLYTFILTYKYITDLDHLKFGVFILNTSWKMKSLLPRDDKLAAIKLFLKKKSETCCWIQCHWLLTILLMLCIIYMGRVAHIVLFSPFLWVVWPLGPDRSWSTRGTFDLRIVIRGSGCTFMYPPADFPTHPCILLGVITLGRNLFEFSICR